MPDLLMEVLRWVCFGCGLAGAEPVTMAEPITALQPRVLPVERRDTAPKVAELTLQGAEPVAELRPRLLPIPGK